jgi:hypothetical protein
MFSSVLLLAILTLSMGENTAVINGSVVDSNKKPVSGAEVYLVPGSGSGTKTDEKGTFSFTSLNPGTYKMIVMHGGFIPWAKGIKIESGQIITVDVSLSAGAEQKAMAKIYEPRSEDLEKFNRDLKSLNEPSLCSQALIEEKQESYRFLWLRSFHDPVLIQLINKGPGKAIAIYKEYGKWNENTYGSIKENKAVDALKKLRARGSTKDMEQRAFDTILERAKKEVWEQPFKYKETIGIDGSVMIGLDGATWTIEAIKDGKCHVVTRWSPEQSDPVRQFAQTLMNLYGKRLYYDEVY